MKFSQNYIFYPPNKALELALANAIARLSEEWAEAATPDTKVTVADNFLHTRGNFEQTRFSANILDSVRAALEGALTDDVRQQSPSAWAEAQNILGNILAAQGQQQREAALYEKAILCFEKALEVFDQGKTPLDWAATLFNLGTANQALGRQQDSAKHLKTAIDAYTNALLVWTRQETPEQWSTTMQQLGTTFHAHGKLLKGNRTFQKAVVAYKNALAVLDADFYALELAATHNNCGAVLQHLAQSEENSARFEEAIHSYETALTVCMEQQLPIHLAVLCRVNKATARNDLAELTKDAALADDVADEFELIVECFQHALQPLCLRHCREQIHKAKRARTVA